MGTIGKFTAYFGLTTAAIFVLTALTIRFRSQRNRYKNERDHYRDNCNLSGTVHCKVAVSFLTSCRLITIHRNGRLNVFTFARGDSVFTIETMGLLSDIPDNWRKQAGLNQ